MTGDVKLAEAARGNMIDAGVTSVHPLTHWSRLLPLVRTRITMGRRSGFHQPVRPVSIIKEALKLAELAEDGGLS